MTAAFLECGGQRAERARHRPGARQSPAAFPLLARATSPWCQATGTACFPEAPRDWRTPKVLACNQLPPASARVRGRRQTRVGGRTLPGPVRRVLPRDLP